MKLPDIDQKPREYHENLKSVVKFIEESVARIESLSQKIEGCDMIDIGGKKYLDESEVKNLISDFAKKKDMDILEVKVNKSAEKIDSIGNDLKSIRSVKHLSINDIKEELKPYELTKHVDSKIKSCRDTMGENYENHAKGVDKKVSQLTTDVEKFKESQSQAHEKLKVDTENSIKSESEKIEKSILKKVLGKVSKLMG